MASCTFSAGRACSRPSSLPEVSECKELILGGDIDWKNNTWNALHDDVQPLVKSMLAPRPRERVTANDVLSPAGDRHELG